MTQSRRNWLLMALLCPWAAGATTAPPPELGALLPQAALSGATRFRYWGFEVYDASLWVQPGFSAERYAQHGFALQLHYLRDFTSESIAKRSIEEMQRQADTQPESWTAWQQSLRAAFPDIRKGDRIMGVHRPGEGALFLTNGVRTGAVRDTEFSRLFFGIWLSASTSEPGLRKSLLGIAAGR